MADPVLVTQTSMTSAVQITQLVLGFITTIATPFIVYLLAKMNTKTDQAAKDRTEAAVKVAEVAVKQEAVAVKVAEVAEKQVIAAEKVAEVAVKQDLVAEKVESVKEALTVGGAAHDRRFGDLKSTIDSTHSLVNSSMGVQLRLNRMNTKRIADLTKDPADIEAANMASRMLADHDAAQAKADAAAAEKK